MLNVAWVLAAALAAACFHLASGHQHWWSVAKVGSRQRWLLAGLLMTGASAWVAATAVGRWPGTFAASAALMLFVVLLPFLDAGLRIRRARDVE